MGFLFTWKSPEYLWFHLCTKKPTAAKTSTENITVTTIIHVIEESSSSSFSLLARGAESTDVLVFCSGVGAKK